MSEPAAQSAPRRRSYPRLTKWAGIFATTAAIIVVLAQLYDMFGPPSLPDCDASRVQSTLRDIIRTKIKVELSNLAEFAAGAKTDDTLACAATLTFADSTRGRLSYKVYIKGRNIMVATEDLKPL